jgi:hypothetical protein
MLTGGKYARIMVLRKAEMTPDGRAVKYYDDFGLREVKAGIIS